MTEIVAAENDAEIATLIAQGIVLLDFYQDGCVPCNNVHGYIAQLGFWKPEVNRVIANVADCFMSAMDHKVMVTPTLALYRDGQLLAVNPSAGRMKIVDDLIEWIEDTIKKADADALIT